MSHLQIVGWSLIVAWGTLSSLARGADETPNPAITPVPRTGAWVSRHEGINSAAKLGSTKLLFLGDSITQGWETKGEIDAIWQKYYAPRGALNAGISGDRTQHVLWRLDHGNIDAIKPRLAVLMIGTNNSAHNSAEQIAEGIKAIVTKLRTKLPETKILVLAIFPRGPNANDPLRKVVQGTNAIVQKLADDKTVFYLDIGEKFLQPDGELSKEIMPDFLHLSPKGYQIWADATESKISELLEEKK
jgi:lysophospholipase L1-like esterase